MLEVKLIAIRKVTCSTATSTGKQTYKLNFAVSLPTSMLAILTSLNDIF